MISVDGEKVISDIKVSDGLWHHMAVTWSSSDGAWAIYLDGFLEEQGQYFARGRKIEGRCLNDNDSDDDKYTQ